MTNIFEQIFGKSLNKSHVGWMVVILQVTGKELQRSAKRSSHDALCDDDEGDDDDCNDGDGGPPFQCIGPPVVVMMAMILTEMKLMVNYDDGP